MSNLLNIVCTTQPEQHGPRKNRTRQVVAKSKQLGYSLAEIAIVAVIILVAAIIGIPQISAIITANKVPALATDLQRFIASSKTAAQGIGTTPFAGVGAAQLANGLRASSVISVDGVGAQSIVSHGVGATDGVITLAPAQITTAGDSYTLTLTKVNDAACADLAATMQRVTEGITINTVTIKAPGVNGAQGVYGSSAAKAACTSGDSNTLVFQAR